MPFSIPLQIASAIVSTCIGGIVAKFAMEEIAGGKSEVVDVVGGKRLAIRRVVGRRDWIFEDAWRRVAGRVERGLMCGW